MAPRSRPALALVVAVLALLLGRATAAQEPLVQPEVSIGSSEAGTIRYESRRIRDLQLLVGFDEQHQVWVSFWTGRHPHVLVCIVNARWRSLLFVPEGVEVVANTVGKRQMRSRHVVTYTAAEWRERFGEQPDWAAALYAQQLRAAQEEAEPLEPGGSLTGWSTEESGFDRLDAMALELYDRFAGMATSLLERTELEPWSYHGGVIHFEHRKTDYYELTVPVDRKAFRFAFSHD